jgi:hypothetical protein
LVGFDGVLLLASGINDDVLAEALSSVLAPRLGVALLSEVRGARFGLELQRIAAAIGSLPPARSYLPTQVERSMALLPKQWRSIVYSAVRSPHEWNVKRLHHACGVDRRTLERWFRRVGLCAPAVLIKTQRDVEGAGQHETL